MLETFTYFYFAYNLILLLLFVVDDGDNALECVLIF